MHLPFRLSVVVPSHDTRELTLGCLSSLVSAPDLEILVVDDGSVDGTAETIGQRFPQVGVLRHEEARGFTAAANRGLAAARGEVLLLLNSDTEVRSGALERLAAAFRERPRLGIAGAELFYPDGSAQWGAGRAPSLIWLFALTSGLPGLLRRLPGYRRLRPLEASARGRVDWVTGAAFAVRRAVWEQLGPLDESYRFYGQDLDYCLRARDAGWTVDVVPGFQVLHHHGSTIGKRPGTVRGREHPAVLWSDLLRWAEKHRGPAWARRARRVMAVGGNLRLLARRSVRPFLAGEDRERFQLDTEAFSDAVASLRGAASAAATVRRRASS